MNRKHKLNMFEDNISYEIDKPSEHVLSEGEILIKNLVKKQINTTTTLNEELLKKKDFVSPQELTQLTTFKAGETTLKDFKIYTENIKRKEDLQFFGLTPYERDFYLDNKKGDEYLQTKYKNLSKNELKTRIEEIRSKIENKNLEKTELEEKNISRHAKELGLSVKPDSEETKLYNFAISSNSYKKEDNTPFNQPITKLKELENELFSYLDRDSIPSLTKRRKRMKKIEENKVLNSFNAGTSGSSQKQSKWDMREDISTTKNNLDITNSEKQIKERSEKVYSCQPLNYYIIQGGEIVKLNSNLNEMENTSNKDTYRQLNEEEIKLIPKFRLYEKGTPSKVLYVKNISKGAKDEFVSLFENNDSEKPLIKIMTGKMQGQAFITFGTEEDATNALNKYNGCILRNKPIIISYGKTQ